MGPFHLPSLFRDLTVSTSARCSSRIRLTVPSLQWSKKQGCSSRSALSSWVTNRFTAAHCGSTWMVGDITNTRDHTGLFLASRYRSHARLTSRVVLPLPRGSIEVHPKRRPRQLLVAALRDLPGLDGASGAPGP